MDHSHAAVILVRDNIFRTPNLELIRLETGSEDRAQYGRHDKTAHGQLVSYVQLGLLSSFEMLFFTDCPTICKLYASPCTKGTLLRYFDQ